LQEEAQSGRNDTYVVPLDDKAIDKPTVNRKKDDESEEP